MTPAACGRVANLLSNAPLSPQGMAGRFVYPRSRPGEVGRRFVRMTQPFAFSRRQFLQTSAAIAVPTLATAETPDLDETAGTLSRFPRAVQQWLEKQVAQRLVESPRHVRPEDVPQLREEIRACFGFSYDPTPLDAESPGTLEREGYRIEKIVYRSRPRYDVPAHLYLPEGEPPAAGWPAVLGLCGHATEGKAAPAYQAFAQRLAINGLACLLVDPAGQGERLMSPEAVERDGEIVWRSPYGGATSQHNRFGLRAHLAGEFFGMWRAYDGIRGIDLLEARGDIDATKIGVTGNSGGGTMTTWVTALDDRIAFSAPSCFVTSFYENLTNELPADAEQCPPLAIARDLDHWHFLAANAPKPVLLIAQRHDFFDVRGTERAYDFLRKLYREMEAPKSLGFYTGQLDHGYHDDAQRVMVRFFLEAVGREGRERIDHEPVIESMGDLACTRSGQVEADGSRPTFAFLADLTERARARRREGNRPLDDRIAAALHPLVDVETPAIATTQPRVLRRTRGAGPRPWRMRYAITTGDGLRPVVTWAETRPSTGLPRPSGAAAVLYVADESSQQELDAPPPALAAVLDELEAAGETTVVYAVDVRGIGELQPRTADLASLRNVYGSDYMHAAYAEMLDSPMFGGRVSDVLAALEFLKQAHAPFVLAGHGQGSPVARVAAYLARDRVARVLTSGGLTTWESVLEPESDLPAYSMLPFGVLKHFDLPELTEPPHRRVEE